jgi:hypothetical protein
MEGGQAQTAPATQDDRLPFSPVVGCVASVLVGALCAGAFFLALSLSQRGEIAYGTEPFRATRLWLLQDVEGRGLGISTTRPLPGATDEEVCALTAVRFVFLGGVAPAADTDFCECYRRGPAGWVSVGPCGE